MADDKPHVYVPPGTTPPTELEIEEVVVGDGPEATVGQDVEVHYVGVAWSTRKQFDASWDRGQTFRFGLGQGQVIKGWDEGVAGRGRQATPRRSTTNTSVSPPLMTPPAPAPP